MFNKITGLLVTVCLLAGVIMFQVPGGAVNADETQSGIDGLEQAFSPGDEHKSDGSFCVDTLPSFSLCPAFVFEI